MASGSTGWCTRLAWLGSILTGILLTTPSAVSQAPAANAAAISGQVSAPLGSLAVSAQVRVCPITASLAPCTPTAQLFTNSALTVLQQNPISTDQYGNYKAFVAAGLYLVQVTVTPGLGPTYTYYVAAGSSNSGGGSSPPAYSVQFASPTAGQFNSDPTIFINPTQHIFEAPEVFVPGTGTGLIGIAGSTSGQTVYQTVSDSTAGWTFTWPAAQPTTPGATNCLVGPTPLSGTTVISSWQSCVLSGQFLPLAGGTLTGPLVGTSANFQSTNTIRNAALDPTVGDIGAKINHALLACSYQCQAYVPAGTYTFATQISIPLNIFGTYGLTLDPGAQLFYTGSSDAIATFIGPSGPGFSDLVIQGGSLIGTSSATSGVRLLPTNGVTIRDMLITGFTSGDGVLVQGADSVQVYGNIISNSRNGIRLIPTRCNSSFPYTCGSSGAQIFTPNAMHIFANEIVVNTHWGIFDDRNSDPGGLTGSLNNLFLGNDLENNGTAGPTFGAVLINHSTGTQIVGNYFEGSPRRVVIGELGAGGALGSNGTVVRDNYFTTQPPSGSATSAYNIELQNSNGATIEGNTELVTGGVGGNNCFLNAATGGETHTYLGHNAVFQTPPSGNPLCVNGAVAQQLAGTGSFGIANSNWQSIIAFHNFDTTSATSDSIAIQFVTAVSECYPVPDNASAAANIATAYVSGYGTGGITFTHAAVAHMHYSIFCAYGPFN